MMCTHILDGEAFQISLGHIYLICFEIYFFTQFSYVLVLFKKFWKGLLNPFR